MIEIRLTEGQAAQIRHSSDVLRLCDQDGALLGFIEPMLTPDQVAELKQRTKSPGPFYSSAQISRRLDALEEERSRLGSIDESRMNEILAHLDEIDPARMRPEAHT